MAEPEQELKQYRKDATVWRIPLEAIHTIAGFNPRGAKNTNEVEDLMNFMRHRKNRRKLTPIHLVERQGMLYLTQGHRRLKAAQKLCQEGVNVSWLPGFIDDDADEFILLAEAMAENQGVPLTALEEARTYKKMLDKGGWSVQEVSTKTGRSPQHIYNRLHLLDASPALQRAVADGKISMTQAVKVVKKARDTGQTQAQVLRVHQASHVDLRANPGHRATVMNHIRGLILPLVDRYGYALVLEVLESIPGFLEEKEQAAQAKENAGIIEATLT